MSFRDEFPDYERYEDDDDYYYSKLPPGVGSSLKGLILRIANKNPHQLKDICHDIASRIPCEPTQNWGWDWLVNDLDDLLDQLSRKKLHKIMDFMHDLVKNHRGSFILEDLNDIFQEYDFGYRLRSNEPGPFCQYYIGSCIKNLKGQKKQLLQRRKKLRIFVLSRSSTWSKPETNCKKLIVQEPLKMRLETAYQQWKLLLINLVAMQILEQALKPLGSMDGGVMISL